MKEKRMRFGEWYQKKESFFNKTLFILWLVVFFFATYIWVGGIKVFTEYSESAYIPLEKAVNAVVDVDNAGMLRMDNCPEGINCSAHNINNGQIQLTFSYSKEDNTILDKPSINVMLENEEIKSVSRNYFSKEDFIRGNIFQLLGASFVFTMFFGGISYSILLLILECIAIKPEIPTKPKLSKPLGLYDFSKVK